MKATLHDNSRNTEDQPEDNNADLFSQLFD